MSTLAAAVNATQTLFSMDEALPAGTKFLRLDDELVRVQNVAYRAYQRDDPDPLQCTVVRGVEGTTAASHDAGTELEPHVDAYATPTPFSVGGAQTIRLLGPYRVNYNDAGMEVNGAGKVVGDDLPVGSVVLAWATMITAWNNVADVTADGRLTIDFQWAHGGGVGVPGSLGELLFQTKATLGYGEDTSSSGWPVQSYGAHDAISRLSTHYHIISPGVKMLIRVRGTNPGTPTQGTADIYALIAEPAA